AGWAPNEGTSGRSDRPFSPWQAKQAGARSSTGCAQTGNPANSPSRAPTAALDTCASNENVLTARNSPYHAEVPRHGLDCLTTGITAKGTERSSNSAGATRPAYIALRLCRTDLCETSCCL